MTNAEYVGITRAGWGGDSPGGVHVLRYGLRKTDTVVHDSPTLYRLDVPPPSPPFETVERRGLFRVNGVRLARTYLAQSYPPELASLVARLTVEALQLRAEARAAGGGHAKSSVEWLLWQPSVHWHSRPFAPTRAHPRNMQGGGCPFCPFEIPADV